ncbi:hypothetical protein Droror1_Dr00015171 [Drosera rotundifolia]
MSLLHKPKPHHRPMNLFTQPHFLGPSTHPQNHWKLTPIGPQNPICASFPLIWSVEEEGVEERWVGVMGEDEGMGEMGGVERRLEVGGREEGRCWGGREEGRKGDWGGALVEGRRFEVGDGKLGLLARRGRESKEEEREVGGRKEGRRGEIFDGDDGLVKLCKCGEAGQSSVDKYGEDVKSSVGIQIKIPWGAQWGSEKAINGKKCPNSSTAKNV